MIRGLQMTIQMTHGKPRASGDDPALIIGSSGSGK